jgi:hypothetical protein
VGTTKVGVPGYDAGVTDEAASASCAINGTRLSATCMVTSSECNATSDEEGLVEEQQRSTEQSKKL